MFIIRAGLVSGLSSRALTASRAGPVRPIHHKRCGYAAGHILPEAGRECGVIARPPGRPNMELLNAPDHELTVPARGAVETFRLALSI